MSLSRGIIIGRIIDDLSNLQSQLKLRCSIGLTDLNKFSEDFIKEALNIIYDINLKNLNDERSNEPGLDLGDRANKIAFQVTSTATSQKVNKTLEKITADQKKDYKDIRIIVLGNKQSTYSIDKEHGKKYSFEEQNIYDITDLSKQIVSLSFDGLHRLLSLFEKEFQIVITELEVPDKEGNYPTSLLDKLEVKPLSKARNAKRIIDSIEELTLEEINNAFNELSNLPRISREFLYTIIERGKEATSFGPINYALSIEKLQRILKISEKELKGLYSRLG